MPSDTESGLLHVGRGICGICYAFGIKPALENRYTATPFCRQLTYTPVVNEFGRHVVIGRVG